MVFRPFNTADWAQFAGSDEGSLIYYSQDGFTCLILSPDGKTISEMLEHGQRDWEVVRTY